MVKPSKKWKLLLPFVVWLKTSFCCAILVVELIYSMLLLSLSKCYRHGWELLCQGKATSETTSSIVYLLWVIPYWLVCAGYNQLIDHLSIQINWQFLPEKHMERESGHFLFLQQFLNLPNRGKSIFSKNDVSLSCRLLVITSCLLII